MTKSEVIMLRNYIKGAYGYDNGGESTDAVWFDLLQEYEYKGIMQAAKNHIKSGNNYPPRVAELISGYELILDDFNDDILDKMAKDGVFDDPYCVEMIDGRLIETEPEVRRWNREKRITKAKNWLQAKSMPDWFKDKYDSYRKQFVSGVKQIEGERE
jgi:hypothetical protein